MVQRGSGTSFAKKALMAFGILQFVFRKKFQRDTASESRVFGFVDDTHSASADFAEDFVVADELFFHEWEQEMLVARKSLWSIQTDLMRNHSAAAGNSKGHRLFESGR